jgi:Ca-activated chloride channel family protein
LRLVTVALLVMAMARPQTGRKLTQVSSEGIDIVLVMDTSGSMQALDLDADRPIQRRRNRLEVAKDVVREFVEGRANDLVGLVVFGDDAFTQCPLTLDHAVLLDLLADVEVGVAGDRTAIGSAIGTAVKRLRQSKAKSKVVVLLTDGRSNAGTLAPATAAELARTQGVKIYTIGAGTRGRAPFLVDSVFGPRVVYQDVDIDEAQLRSIAETTGGAYYRAEEREALRSIYDEIDRLERTEITTQSYVEYEDRYSWFVVAALGLLMVEVALLGTRLRALP